MTVEEIKCRRQICLLSLISISGQVLVWSTWIVVTLTLSPCAQPTGIMSLMFVHAPTEIIDSGASRSRERWPIANSIRLILLDWRQKLTSWITFVSWLTAKQYDRILVHRKRHSQWTISETSCGYIWAPTRVLHKEIQRDSFQFRFSERLYSNFLV